jgi:hypothetical protein
MHEGLPEDEKAEMGDEQGAPEQGIRPLPEDHDTAPPTSPAASRAAGDQTRRQGIRKAGKAPRMSWPAGEEWEGCPILVNPLPWIICQIADEPVQYSTDANSLKLQQINLTNDKRFMFWHD